MWHQLWKTWQATHSLPGPLETRGAAYCLEWWWDGKKLTIYWDESSSSGEWFFGLSSCLPGNQIEIETGTIWSVEEMIPLWNKLKGSL